MIDMNEVLTKKKVCCSLEKDSIFSIKRTPKKAKNSKIEHLF